MAHGRVKGKALQKGENGEYQCKFCQLIFSEEGPLKEHEVVHSDQRKKEVIKYREDNFKCNFLIGYDDNDEPKVCSTFCASA